MPFIEENGKIYAKCDGCGYISQYPRKSKDDVPQGWGGNAQYLRCCACDQECSDQQGEAELWASLNW